MNVDKTIEEFNDEIDKKEKKYEPFHFVEKNEVIDEPKNLYVLEFGFTMPITRNSYRKEKTAMLHLDAVSKPGYGLYPSDTNKCVEGAYLLEDYAYSAELETQHGMKHGKYELDVDYYTAEWSFNRSDSDSHWTRSFVKCEHSWDIDMDNPKELQNTKVNFIVSVANENKELCYKELKELYKETIKYGKDVLRNEKDLIFDRDVDGMLKKAEKVIASEKKQEKISLKPLKEKNTNHLGIER